MNPRVGVPVGFVSDRVPVPARIAPLLKLPRGEEVVLRRCLRSVDGQPWSIQDSYFPIGIVERFPELESLNDIARGTINYLQEGGIYQVGFLDQITSRMPTPGEHEFLRTPKGVPVLVQIRTAYTKTQVVRTTETIWAGDRNVVVYELGDLDALYPGAEK